MAEHIEVECFCKKFNIISHESYRLEDLAEELDNGDELRNFRNKFHFPVVEDNNSQKQAIYLCGNSLGLQPKNMRENVNNYLDKWALQGVEGHFEEPNPWLTIDDTIVDSMAQLVGALPFEVTVMNSLTANLHFIMSAFYRPTKDSSSAKRSLIRLDLA